MAKFDLKSAIAFLPVMTGKEDVTKQLIDCLDFYSSYLDTDSQPILIKFVLKTRLNDSAKLRLSQSYNSCISLIKDMRKYLLTKQSAVSLMSELFHVKQHSRTIEKFGSKIEDLFVRLTISQADGDEQATRILLPINEKIAIQRFITGLRNYRINIILSARGYTSLKDVIQAAKDEEIFQISRNKWDYKRNRYRSRYFYATFHNYSNCELLSERYKKYGSSSKSHRKTYDSEGQIVSKIFDVRVEHPNHNNSMDRQKKRLLVVHEKDKMMSILKNDKESNLVKGESDIICKIGKENTLKSQGNVAADTLSLEHEMIYKKGSKDDMSNKDKPKVTKCRTNNWPDHPRVVESFKLPKDQVDIRFIKEFESNEIVENEKDKKYNPKDNYSCKDNNCRKKSKSDVTHFVNKIHRYKDIKGI